MNGVHIRQAEGGYIIDVVGRERIATTLEDVLTFLLLHFEGRAESFMDDAYGSVTLWRSDPIAAADKLWISVNEAPPTPQAEPEPDPVRALPDIGSEAPSEPVVASPSTFTCPICYRDGFKRLVGVIGHAYGKHGQTLTAKEIVSTEVLGD